MNRCDAAGKCESSERKANRAPIWVSVENGWRVCQVEKEVWRSGEEESGPRGVDKAEEAGPGGDGSPRWILGGGQGIRNLSRTGTSPVSSTSQRLFGAGSGGTIFSTIQRCGCSWVLLKPCQCLDLLSVLRFCRLQHRSSEHRHVVVVCLPGASSLPTSAVHNHWAHGPISPAAHTRPHHSGASHPGGLA